MNVTAKAWRRALLFPILLLPAASGWADVPPKTDVFYDRTARFGSIRPDGTAYIELVLGVIRAGDLAELPVFVSPVCEYIGPEMRPGTRFTVNLSESWVIPGSGSTLIWRQPSGRTMTLNGRGASGDFTVTRVGPELSIAIRNGMTLVYRDASLTEMRSEGRAVFLVKSRYGAIHEIADSQGRTVVAFQWSDRARVEGVVVANEAFALRYDDDAKLRSIVRTNPREEFASFTYENGLLMSVARSRQRRESVTTYEWGNRPRTSRFAPFEDFFFKTVMVTAVNGLEQRSYCDTRGVVLECEVEPGTTKTLVINAISGATRVEE